MGKPSSMDAKYKDDLFRKYVQFHESQGDATPSSDESLRAAASTLLSLHKVDPCYRFRLIQFYEVVESSLRSLRSSSLRALRCAFSVLETMGINLFLCPWKKEFRSIKVRSGDGLCMLLSPLAPSCPSWEEGLCPCNLLPLLGPSWLPCCHLASLHSAFSSLVARPWQLTSETVRLEGWAAPSYAGPWNPGQGLEIILRGLGNWQGQDPVSTGEDDSWRLYGR